MTVTAWGIAGFIFAVLGEMSREFGRRDASLLSFFAALVCLSIAFYEVVT